MISYSQAKKIIESNLNQINEYEEINIENAYGRVNFEDIFSENNVLNFKRCAVDGFAIRSADLNIGMSSGLKISDSIDAGQVSHHKIEKGECIKVSTGSPLPKGADMVVMIEDTEIKGNRVIITKEQKRKNYDEVGSDIMKGEKILMKGEILNEGKIALLAAVGKRKIKVFRKICIGLIATGTELKEPGEKIKYGEVYNSNTYMLLSKLSSICSIKNYGIIEDDYNMIKEIFNSSKEDLIITTGGTSMGEKDIVFKIVEEEGEMLFHKIAIQPGKPTFFGKFKNKFIFGLPGNPASCFMIMHTLLIPAIKTMSRIPQKTEEKELEITEEIKAGNRDLFMPVKISENKAIPTFKHSGAISSVAHADGYVVIKTNESVGKGDKVKVILFC